MAIVAPLAGGATTSLPGSQSARSAGGPLRVSLASRRGQAVSLRRRRCPHRLLHLRRDHPHRRHRRHSRHLRPHAPGAARGNTLRRDTTEPSVSRGTVCRRRPATFCDMGRSDFPPCPARRWCNNFAEWRASCTVAWWASTCEPCVTTWANCVPPSPPAAPPTPSPPPPPPSPPDADLLVFDNVPQLVRPEAYVFSSPMRCEPLQGSTFVHPPAGQV